MRLQVLDSDGSLHYLELGLLGITVHSSLKSLAFAKFLVQHPDFFLQTVESLYHRVVLLPVQVDTVFQVVLILSQVERNGLHYLLQIQSPKRTMLVHQSILTQQGLADFLQPLELISDQLRLFLQFRVFLTKGIDHGYNLLGKNVNLELQRIQRASVGVVPLILLGELVD